jgi:hypothetical protein
MAGDAQGAYRGLMYRNDAEPESLAGEAANRGGVGA